MTNTSSWVAAAALLGMPFVAAAQANPADPVAPGPALGYASAFSDYKPWQDIPPGDWRAVNDTVREAAEKGSGDGKASSSVPVAVPAGTQAPAGHHGHGHGHGGRK